MKHKIYRHYKSKGLYEFIDYGKLESDSSDVVIYKRIKDGQIWVRPAKEWFDTVLCEDNTVTYRYEKVHDEEM